MKETKIYILIPVYNVEQYLDNCLASILSQNYSEYEIILVNDGSKDTSGEICNRYAEQNPHIHVIHKENGGLISARLTAINYVRENCEYTNTYCIFVDSDDELKVGALTTINHRIVSSGCDMLIYGYEKFNSEGVFYTTLEEQAGEKFLDDRGDLFREAVIEHTYNSLCRKAVRTEMLFFEIEDHIKSIQMGEDLLQSLEIYKQSPRTLIVPDILYRYRVNLGSITQTFNLKRFTDELFSRYHAINLITELSIWEDNDFNRFFDNSLVVIQWDIRHILMESPSRRDTLNNLMHIYEHPFVQSYCLEKISKKSSIWLRQFSKKHFRILCYLHKLSTIKNGI